MPIYAYRCTGCGHELDALQKVSDAPLTECPSCHQPLLAKMVTAAGFQLKGSGWYATDFRDKPATKKDTKAEPGNGESKGDAKPAPEAAAKPADAASKPAESASAAPSPAPASAPPPAAG